MRRLGLVTCHPGVHNPSEVQIQGECRGSWSEKAHARVREIMQAGDAVKWG